MVWFLLYSDVNQLQVYTYPLPLGFPSHTLPPQEDDTSLKRRCYSKAMCLTKYKMLTTLRYGKERRDSRRPLR